MNRTLAKDRVIGHPTSSDGLWLRIARGIYRAWELSRQRRAMALLSDALLDDIGLTREEVMAESRRPFWRE